jgi:hypothetical protein
MTLASTQYALTRASATEYSIRRKQFLLETVANVSITPTSLADIAADSGFSMSDVAFLAGLDESTVCRLWEEPDWLDKIKGRSLQALISVLPGIAEYLFA